MASDAKQMTANNLENFQAPNTGHDYSISSADIFKTSDTQKGKTTSNEPATLEFSNPFAKQEPNDSNANQLTQAEKPGEKPLRRSDLPDTKKFTPQEQEKVAADLAKQISEKGFTPAPELRDKIREAMLRVYMDGDKDGAGNQKALDKFIEQMNEKLPKGMSLKVDASETNKDFTNFRERAQAAIDKQPGMKMGTCGQLQLCKTEDGKTTVVDKMHYAASIRKTPPTANG